MANGGITTESTRFCAAVWLELIESRIGAKLVILAVIQSKMNKNPSVAIDSQICTYLVQAWTDDGPDLSDPLYEEKIALVRLIFNKYGAFHVAPTVIREYGKIPDPQIRFAHQDFNFFSMIRPEDLADVESRTLKYSQHHPGEKNLSDCGVVAETESCDVEVLLSFDSDLIKRLKSKTQTLRILKPSELWAELAIPMGSPRQYSPHENNPLSAKTWWRW
jgi:hypothetical protein